MNLLDANLLLYAYDEESPFHVQARAFFETRLSGDEPVGLPWATILAFLRLSTHSKVCSRPLAIEEALEIVDSWFGSPVVCVPEPTDRHWVILAELLNTAGARGNLVPDAHLAALAVQHGARLCSSDRDFERFASWGRLNWLNPLRQGGWVHEHPAEYDWREAKD